MTPAYAFDSPAWERWFAFEHEEAKRRGVRDVSYGSPLPPLVVRDEDKEAEAAYQAELAAVLRESEEERRKVEEEETAYQACMAEAMALSAAGDCVVPPLAPPSPAKAELVPTPIERYSWTRMVRKWVSASPVRMGAAEAQEHAYLEQWRQRRLAEERREGEHLEQLKRDARPRRRRAMPGMGHPSW